MLEQLTAYLAYTSSLLEATSPTVKAALIGAAATALSATVATIVVFKQIGRQARNALKQKHHEEALKLKLQLYETLLKVYHEALDAQTQLSGYIRSFNLSLFMVRSAQDAGQPWSMPRERYLTLSQHVLTAGTRCVEAIFVVEEWITIDPRLDIFRIALAAANFDIGRDLKPYQDMAMRMMPTTKHGAADEADVFPWEPPPQEKIDALEKLSEVALNSISDRTCYLIDFRNEMQNLLVSELFGNKAPARKPIDPRLKVIRLEEFAQLKRYFENETEFGIHNKKLEDSVRENLATSAQAKD